MTLIEKYHDFMKKANKKLKTKKDVIQFQKELKKNEDLMMFRNLFIDEYMLSVTRMMGDTLVWYQTMPCVKLYDDDGLSDANYQKVLCDLHKDRSFGEDLVLIHDYHWNCMKDGDEKVFDPYDDYQIPIYTNGEKNNGLYGYTDVARVTTPSVTVSARLFITV